MSRGVKGGHPPVPSAGVLLQEVHFRFGHDGQNTLVGGVVRAAPRLPFFVREEGRGRIRGSSRGQLRIPPGFLGFLLPLTGRAERVRLFDESADGRWAVGAQGRGEKQVVHGAEGGSQHQDPARPWPEQGVRWRRSRIPGPRTFFLSLGGPVPGREQFLPPERAPVPAAVGGGRGGSAHVQVMPRDEPMDFHFAQDDGDSRFGSLYHWARPGKGLVGRWRHHGGPYPFGGHTRPGSPERSKTGGRTVIF